MASDERKLAKSSLISLEIDPASILSLSKGVIFDTIVHNIEYTLSNQRTDPLPWKLIGMSLICDPNRNKKYMHKLQKMQCIRAVICTQIYHSKLIKNESGILTTPGRKISLATSPRKRLTGIIVCRSIDDLLFMESSTTENVHFIQYKLLSYERIPTRDLVNGPKVSSVGDKVIKTVFDFELTQNNGFPRQLLPVAVISFAKEVGFDLIGSIRHFLTLDEHKTFDKSYLVTSINVEFDRLREEQERKEDAEIEERLALEKMQRRQPLADLSRKSTDTGNASSAPTEQRVPPLIIRFPPNKEKQPKPTVSIPPVDTKFRCLLKLDRVDLSSYDISNLPTSPSMKPKKSNEFPTLSSSVNNNKIKPLTITKPHEHHKPLKRLNTTETKKQSSFSSELSKNKHSNDSTSISSSTNGLTITIPKNTTKQRLASSSSMSPIYRPKPANQKPKAEKPVIKKKVQREVLPSNYHCSLPLTRIDLSMYDIDLPPMITSVNTVPMDVESTVTSLPTTSTISEPTNVSVKPEIQPDTTQSTTTMEEEPIQENISETQPFVTTNTHENFPHIIDQLLTPDLNEPESNTNNEVVPQTIDEPVLAVVDEVRSIPMNETAPEVIGEMVTQTTNEVLPTANEETSKPTPSSSPQYTAYSPVLPPLDDDPVLLSLENPQIPVTDTSNLGPQDYIIIVPCSDDEDDFGDHLIDDKQSNIINKESDIKTIESLSSPFKNSTLIHPSLTRVLGSSSRLTSHRLSTSSSSSCSSISTSILHNQSPCSPLQLTEILLSQKILNKKQRKSRQPITFNRYDFCIPTIAQEPLIDPRLIYRLQSITNDLRWEKSCTQCSSSSSHPSLCVSSTQTILYDRKNPSDFVDPRRESLKITILDLIYQRIKLLIPNIFIINSNQFQKLLFEQTIFKINCSIHLEHLLQRLKRSDDMNFFHMIKTNDDFQLSPIVLQLIFN